QVPWFFTPSNLAGATSDLTRVATSDYGPGRSLIFRQPLKVCDESMLSTYGTMVFPITVSWTAPGTTSPQLEAPSVTIESMLAADSFPTQKATAILEYGSALQGASHDRLTHAFDVVSSALSAKPGDAELTEILGLIQKDPIYAGSIK